VAAGVHDPRSFAGKGQAGFLLHGQGVDVRPEGHGFALAALQHRPAAGAARKAVYRITHGLQLLLNVVRGPEFLPGELRVPVEPAALFGDIASGGLGGLSEIHKKYPFPGV
jgi:hypothetical protein